MISIAEPYLDSTEIKNVLHALKTGWISSKGDFIQDFERKFAEFCNVKYGVSTSNGTSALHLALLALGIGKGDEVIVPSLTFISPVNMVSLCGAKPVFVDSHPEYWGIDPSKIEKAITKKTKAIIAVHLYGHPCDMDKILKIAKKYNLFIIEDAAEAHGARYKGKIVGSFGVISCFSFFGNKNMTTGEGGICLTNDQDLSKKMGILKNHGMSERKYWHDIKGFNYRMTNIQAAIGLVQLRRLEKFIEVKKNIGNDYKRHLETKEVFLHPKMSFADNTIWLYTILLKNKNEKQRDEIIQKLSQKGIETRPFFYPIHLMPPYKTRDKFPIAESISKEGISLPSHVKLKKEQVKFICEEIKKLI